MRAYFLRTMKEKIGNFYITPVTSHDAFILSKLNSGSASSVFPAEVEGLELWV